MARVKKH